MLRRIFLYQILLFFTLACKAQQGLHVNDVFTGKVVPMRSGVEIKVKGKSVNKFKLNYYHSFKFEATQEQAAEVSRIASKDAFVLQWMKKTCEKRTDIVMYHPQGSTNRFLCLVVEPVKDHCRVIVIYMEGWAKDIDELRKLINK